MERLSPALFLLLILAAGSAHASDPLSLDFLKGFFGGGANPATTTTPAPVHHAGHVPRPRILGGLNVGSRCQAPFNAMVALKIRSTNQVLTYCSGVMITPQIIVTAGLCLIPYLNFPGDAVYAVVGEKNSQFTDTYEQEQLIPSSQLKIHPDYNSTTGDNNIGLIQLNTAVILNDCVQPLMRFNSNTQTCYNSVMNCTVTGWGTFNREGSLVENSMDPLYGHVRVFDDVLLSAIPNYIQATKGEGYIFALPYNSNVEACLMDWGGMVACEVGNEWLLRGVIGIENCNSLTRQATGTPIHVTSVELYQAWINRCIANFQTQSQCPGYVPI